MHLKYSQFTHTVWLWKGWRYSWSLAPSGFASAKTESTLASKWVHCRWNILPRIRAPAHSNPTLALCWVYIYVWSICLRYWIVIYRIKHIQIRLLRTRIALRTSFEGIHTVWGCFSHSNWFWFIFSSKFSMDSNMRPRITIWCFFGCACMENLCTYMDL